DEPNHGPTLSEFWGDFIDGYKHIELAQISWTQRLPEVFRRRFGYDLLDHLPLLFLDVGRPPATPRYHYHQLTTSLLESNFCGAIGRWCRSAGLALTGHMQGEHPLAEQTSLVGAAMRHYRHFDMPGIDVLGADCDEYETAIACTSAANQLGRRHVMSETNGATGWDVSFETLKALGDWQLALGVTRRCIHLAHYTLAGAAKRDYPPSISFQSAWWRRYGVVENYFSRMASVLARGAPIRDALVVHPIESMWLLARMGWRSAADVARLEERFHRLTRTLLAEQISFDFGDEQIMARRAKVREGKLVVGKMSYGTVVVPAALTIRSETLALIEAFVRRKGRVLWVGAPPRWVDAKPSDRAKQMARHCECVRTPREAARRLAGDANVRLGGRGSAHMLHQLRRDRSRHYLFLANTRASGVTCDVTVKPRGQVRQWDAHSGDVHNVPGTLANAATRFTVRLPGHGSGLFTISPSRAARRGAPVRRRRVLRRVVLPAAWDYELSEPNPLVLDQVRVQPPGRRWSGVMEALEADAWLRTGLGITPRRYHDVQPWAAPRGTATTRGVRVRYLFNVRTGAARRVGLALEHMPGLRAAQLNGHRINLKRDAGWWIDPCLRRHRVDPRWLKRGRNELLK
ncbi:MAG: glycosyl hydrolase, partial [Phycisphaeraceae bacterium]|nr:glycosyl hydrolase [Phycisphaeraceae bacterium]